MYYTVVGIIVGLLLGMAMATAPLEFGVLPSFTSTNNPQDYVNLHNQVRADVGVPPLAWDDKVAAYAEDYGKKRAGDCRTERSNGPYGENLAQGMNAAPYGAWNAVALWSSGKDAYNYTTNSCVGTGGDCEHYTQMVWRSSLRLGCARVECFNGLVLIICNYDPPGNVKGQRPY